MIREKTQAEFKRDQANAVGQIVEIFRCEKGTPDAEIPLKYRSAQLEIKRHLIELQCFLSESVATGTQAVTNVVVHKPRLHSVEIDQADCLTAVFIDHHVIDLGISVNRSTMKRP